jgi:hypothetical protein
MAPKPDEAVVQGWSTQGGTSYLSVHAAIPHGSAAPHDSRPGFLKAAMPMGHNAQVNIPGAGAGTGQDSLQTVRGLPPIVVQATPITRVHGTASAVILGVQDGVGTVTVSTVTSLPTGMALAANGKLSWTAATPAGSTAIAVQATDSAGNTAAKTVTMTLT